MFKNRKIYTAIEFFFLYGFTVQHPTYLISHEYKLKALTSLCTGKLYTLCLIIINILNFPY
jgi:hypothetical protein